MANTANKIDAKDKTLSQILSGQRYRVDSFQREYRWQRKQIEALISDLSITFLSNYKPGDAIEDSLSYDCYYMGPVVLCEDKNDLSIIDGQQRLTSFTLLLLYLYHRQQEIHTSDELRDLKTYLYVSKGGRKTLVLNIESRINVIEHLFRNPNEIYDDFKIGDESVSTILSRYEDISVLFPEEINQDIVLPLFVEWLLERVILVEVKAYSMENAYTIFETMNDRGMTLSPTEILKGFLLSKISDDKKSDEVNEFWKNRISLINRETKLDADLDFFRAWLRAKYAITSRSKNVNSENEDFELIATQFHSWVKNNTKKIQLKDTNDFYYFILSDFDFYSQLYIDIFKFRAENSDIFNELYINNFYPIADSLYYPLMLSSVIKIDDKETISEKLIAVNKYIDIYTNMRVLSGKSITQSSIRHFIYDVIKDLRNVDIDNLKAILAQKIQEILNREYGYQEIHQMNNWGYFHYFYARILYYFSEENINFSDLMRSKKQNSFVLCRIFNDEDLKIDGVEINQYNTSVANFCLIRRYHTEDFFRLQNISSKVKFLKVNNYLVELDSIDFHISAIEFIQVRDVALNNIVEKIWNRIFF